MLGGVALWSLWWVWLAAALALGIFEVLAPGFIFLGFSIGAALVGLLLLTPLTPGFAALLAIFAVLSLIAWLVLRRFFRAPGGNVRRVETDIND
ncbi:hypothetical protein ROG8370_01945 [Roseovarius gaetbuli]|uniref:NfeD-like C-terminal domain-containing protein n=1 Tax=Roseovarius gaetbuli TaxID=1356575 RepID=A0A1X6ZAJ7_9RHOB|nr:hypothetical protein [Roseovarius gaetbuli]SLN45443.1 hypothetical protein ROG8370_01945 [Roseovarius gaetbuli]